jgi:hypothetical protein
MRSELEAVKFSKKRWSVIVIGITLLLSVSIWIVKGVSGLIDWRYRVVLKSLSPDLSAFVAVREKCGPPDCSIRISLVRNTLALDEVQLLALDDCVLKFAHIAWSPDSRYVAFFVRTTYCGTTIKYYDSLNRRELDSPAGAELLRDSIRREYNTSYGNLTQRQLHFG